MTDDISEVTPEQQAELDKFTDEVNSYLVEISKQYKGKLLTAEEVVAHTAFWGTIMERHFAVMIPLLEHVVRNMQMRVQEIPTASGKYVH